MIAYFDSSSIVKWFFDEPSMDLARGIKERAEIAFTSLIAFPEVMSAINRAYRSGRCSSSDMKLIKEEFSRIWLDFQRIGVNDGLIQHAGSLIFNYGLRAVDAVHLASALLLRQESEGIEFFFSCFDNTLNSAALKEGFKTHQLA